MTHKQETLRDLIESLEDKEVIKMAHAATIEIPVHIVITPLQCELFNKFKRESDQNFEEDVVYLKERYTKEAHIIMSFEKVGLFSPEVAKERKSELIEEYAESVCVLKRVYAEGKLLMLCKFITRYVETKLFIPLKNFNGEKHFSVN